MAWGFVQRLLGGQRARRPAGSAPAIGGVTARPSFPIVTGSQPIVPAARSSVAMRIPAIEEPSPSAAVTEQMREQLARGLRQLDAGMDASHRTSDLAHLARELRNNPATTIRQLPLAAQRALAMLGDDASTASLALLFERDPAITQALLVRANSAYYNPTGKRILSLTNGITRLGRGGVRNVLIEQSLQGLVCRPGGALDQMVEQVWSHMVRTAPLARSIAPAFGVDPEQAFSMGLLHDVGKLVMFDRLTALRARSRRDVDVDHAVLVRALRLLHEPLGGIAVQRWGLGDDAALSVATHHREPLPARRDRLGEVLYVAERMDLAQVRGAEFNPAVVWRAGNLTGDLDAASTVNDELRMPKAS